jgi:hypothetical protein
MIVNLPPIIHKYIDANNAHDVKSILACFSEDAVVRDENASHRGKIDIERWITTTIEKYNFQFKPLKSQERVNETVVSVEVSGTFPGSPISLDYYFAIAGNQCSYQPSERGLTNTLCNTKKTRSLRGPVPFCHLRLFCSRNGKSQKAVSPGSSP